MVLCPACGAENPDGTKICVKCATELPKSAIPGSAEAKKQVVPGPSGSSFSLWQHAKAMPQDVMDALWLVVIVLLVLIGFLGEATDWKFRFADVEDSPVEEVQLPPAVEQAMPAPVKKIVHRPMPPPAPKPKAVAPKPTPPPPPPAPPIEEVKAPVVVKPTPAPIVAAAKPTPKPAEKPQAPLAVVAAPVVKPPASKPTPRPVLGEKPPAGLANTQSIYDQSKSKFDAQQYETSFKLLKQALQVDPTYAKAYFGLGYIYNLFSMEDASVRMYEMSLRFDPQHASSMNNLGMIYFRAKNYDDAIYLLQKAVMSDPKNGDYPYNLANALVESGRTAEALAYFEKAVQLKPKEAVYYNDLALAYEKMGKASQAEQAWMKVSELTSDPKLFDQAQTHLEFIKQQGPPAG